MSETEVENGFYAFYEKAEFIIQSDFILASEGIIYNIAIVTISSGCNFDTTAAYFYNYYPTAGTFNYLGTIVNNSGTCKFGKFFLNGLVNNLSGGTINFEDEINIYNGNNGVNTYGLNEYITTTSFTDIIISSSNAANNPITTQPSTPSNGGNYFFVELLTTDQPNQYNYYLTNAPYQPV